MTLGGALSAAWEAARTISVVIAWAVVIATGLVALLLFVWFGVPAIYDRVTWVRVYERPSTEGGKPIGNRFTRRALSAR